MNKYTFSLLFSLLSISAFAQKNEIKVMYSPVSLQRMDSWGRDFDDLSARYTGAFIIDYNRYLNPRLKLGVNVTYDQKIISGTKSTLSRNPNPPYDYITTTYKQSNKSGWLFFGPQLGYEYIQMENFCMGSLLGVSMVLINYEDKVAYMKTTETDINFLFHAEIINFTWGKTNGITGQLGCGHKGLVSLGYFFRW